ncbi:MAG TPA: hypothetical protein VGX51_08805 [Solirubrobacteraceae bacterium]|nr:hypothetical protein [Solirubrobacteraceae bacterium]
MFHLQLRQFPHNHCQFNLSEEELAPIVEVWARDRWVLLGERKWSPHQAKLTIIDGPRIELAALSMGRGWRQVERDGRDVTERLLEHARAGPTPSDAPPSAAPPAAVAPGTARQVSEAMAAPAGADEDVHALLGGGGDAESLLQAWRTVTARAPQLSPSERLALAELQVRTAGADPSA